MVGQKGHSSSRKVLQGSGCQVNGSLQLWDPVFTSKHVFGRLDLVLIVEE